MIRGLEIKDIPQVAVIHMRELSGFLPELGEKFLQAFYRTSLDIPEMFTYVESQNEQVYGFTTGINTAGGLYKKIILKDVFLFIPLFLSYLFTHPSGAVKIIKTLAYPGFADNSPELLTIAVKKNHQGRGIGKKLFMQVAREFKIRNIEEFKISVYDRLTANRFYLKIGCRFDRSFEFLGEKMNYYKYEIKSQYQRSNVK